MAWTSDVNVIDVTPASDFMGLGETSAWLGMSHNTFLAAVKRGHFPDGFMIANVRKWSRRALLEWIAEKALEQAQAARAKK